MTDFASLPGPSDRDWPEDFKHENGNYVCRCYHCRAMFYGYKRRQICKKCFTQAREGLD